MRDLRHLATCSRQDRHHPVRAYCRASVSDAGQRIGVSQKRPTITRRSPTRSRLLADEPDNMRGARWQCRGGTPRIFLSALAQRKAADPTSLRCKRLELLSVDKA